MISIFTGVNGTTTNGEKKIVIQIIRKVPQRNVYSQLLVGPQLMKRHIWDLNDLEGTTKSYIFTIIRGNSNNEKTTLYFK